MSKKELNEKLDEMYNVSPYGPKHTNKTVLGITVCIGQGNL